MSKTEKIKQFKLLYRFEALKMLLLDRNLNTFDVFYGLVNLVQFSNLARIKMAEMPN